jgi:hypothetical protein
VLREHCCCVDTAHSSTTADTLQKLTVVVVRTPSAASAMILQAVDAVAHCSSSSCSISVDHTTAAAVPHAEVPTVIAAALAVAAVVAPVA